jgi:two-component system cell cycle sensor histidine kinase/response regulator CckA
MTHAAAPLRPNSPSRQRLATILVVDDQELVRGVVAELLALEGHEILSAQDATEALELVRAHPDGIELVVTDVVLPGVSGLELAARLRADRPGLRVLFTSGHPEDSIPWESAPDERSGFLEKPFSAATLADRVASLLAA